MTSNANLAAAAVQDLLARFNREAGKTRGNLTKKQLDARLTAIAALRRQYPHLPREGEADLGACEDETQELLNNLEKS